MELEDQLPSIVLTTIRETTGRSRHPKKEGGLRFVISRAFCEIRCFATSGNHVPEHESEH